MDDRRYKIFYPVSGLVLDDLLREEAEFLASRASGPAIVVMEDETIV